LFREIVPLKVVPSSPASADGITLLPSLTLDGYEASLGPVKRYTGMQVYNRPQETILVLGSVLMVLGLVWHFYFRHLDRKREGKADA